MRSISQEPYIIWLSFMVQMCKMIFPGVFFNFKILIFWVFRGLKGQKVAQNDKKFCLSDSVSQELYIIWLWFLAHACKMMISPANLFIFQNFDFWSFYGGKRAKGDLKLPISVCFALYIRNCRWYHQDFDNGIYWCFSWFYFLLAHFNSFFNNYFVFQIHQ